MTDDITAPPPSPRFVWRLTASFPDPFCDGGPQTRDSSTVFATKALAESRLDPFRAMIRRRLKLRDDYPIEARVVPMEVIEA